MGSGCKNWRLQYGRCYRIEMNKLEEGSFALFFEGQKMEPISLDNNMVGFCAQCDSDLISFAYYKNDIRWLVSAKCRNNHYVLIQYDLNWNWLIDQDLELSEIKTSFCSVPQEKLAAVFTPAEIRDMLAFESGTPFTRQNLYRARAKFDKFEKLFGIKLKL